MNLTKLSLACLLAMALFFTATKPTQALESSWWSAVKDNGLGQIGATAYNQPDRPKDIRLITANLVRVFLGLLGTIFVVLMVAAGFIWMTAAGNPEKVSKATNLMAMGAIGLLITLGAFAISLYVSSRIIYSTQVNNATDPIDINIKATNRYGY
jgi:hypothetical protein